MTAVGWVRRWAGVLVVCGLFVWLGRDGRHHWHEWRYAYSAAHYSIPALVAGEFDPGPPPERSAAEVGAWYWGQVFHEVILARLLRAAGTGAAALRRVQSVYGLFVVVGAGCAYLTLRRLAFTTAAWRTACIVLLSPLGCWMGFKLMAEPPAFLFASVSVLCVAFAVTSGGWPGRVALTVAAGVSLMLSFLTMVYLPLLVTGFLFAMVLVPPQGAERRRVLAVAAGTLAVGGAANALALRRLSLEPAQYLQMYAFYRAFAKSWLVSLFGVATAWSLLYPLMPLAFARDARKTAAFFAAWAGAALLPLVFLSSNYLESRHLVVALVPCAGLVGLGLTRVADACAARAGWKVPGAARAAVLVVVPLVTWLTLPLMPFEMNSRELRTMVQRIYAWDDAAVLLVPWNYTDFHYLTLAFPARDIVLVQAPVDATGNVVHDEAWERRRAATYGAAFVASPAGLAPYAGRPQYYLGHGRLPPFQNLKRLADGLGLRFISRRLDDMNPLVHIEHSWMWENPAFVFEEAARSRWYTAYRVRPRTS